ncbi:MAG: hypothetical protein PHU21_07835 [Elusimicrobia bacterium]|nr:hypothetical protein [Elusimicrobiota bacterium]
MDPQETQDTPAKETRGRQAKVIPITVSLTVPDHSALMTLTLKRMKQLGEDVPRDRV